MTKDEYRFNPETRRIEFRTAKGWQVSVYDHTEPHEIPLFGQTQHPVLEALSQKFGWVPVLNTGEPLAPVTPADAKPLEAVTTLPADAAARKAIPLASGVLDYFPDALVAVAKVSKAGNDQHNPGQPLHWARGKSTDQADTLLRHFLERGTFDTDGVRHSAKMAWRALALLQLELEAAGAPKARGAK